MNLTERPQTATEEMANAASHALGCLLALASLPVVLSFASTRGSTVHLVGVSVFSATMILLYFASALYHALPQGRAKRLCQTIDHAAIFLFIAGSYTPFLLGVMPPAWGLPMLGVVWALAIVGVLLKLSWRLGDTLLSTVLYVAMGWLVLVAIGPLVRSISSAGLAWLLAGGVAYMAGLVFFLLDSKLRFAHFVWHLFVLVGSTCHFFAALWHSASRAV